VIKCHDFRILDRSPGQLCIKAELTMGKVAKALAASLSIIYTIRENGIGYSVSVKKNERISNPVPRFGIYFTLTEGIEQLRYFGRGPIESYPDKRHASTVGYYETTVTEHFEHYIVPQENNAHMDTALLQVAADSGHGLIFTGEPSFSFNAAHYSAEELTKKRHDYELESSPLTFVNIDYKQHGIGSGSCGPQTFAPYRFDEGEWGYEFVVKAGVTTASR
jgi:beta-galactosidase